MLMEMQPHLFLSVNDNFRDQPMEVTGQYRSYNLRDPAERESWIEARELISRRKKLTIEKLLAESSHLVIAEWAHHTIIEELRNEVLDFEPSERLPEELLSSANRLFSSVKRFLEYRNLIEAPLKSELYPDYWQIDLNLAEEGLLDAVEALSYVNVKEQLRFLLRTKNLFPQNTRINFIKRKLESVEMKFALSFTDLVSGKQVAISDYLGNVVLIDFWATWCQPCLNQVPQFKRLIRQYHESGLRILGVSCDEPELVKYGKQYIRSKKPNLDLVELEKHVLTCAETHGMEWPICVDKNLADRWAVKSIPTVFAIDRKGVLRSTNVAGMLSSIVPELLQE